MPFLRLAHYAQRACWTHCVTIVSPASVGGGDVTNRHNLSCNAVYETCRQASLSVRLEAGGGLGKDMALTRPSDILVSNPSGSASAAYDITVTSPLIPQLFWKREFQQVQQPKQQRCVSILSMMLSALN